MERKFLLFGEKRYLKVDFLFKKRGDGKMVVLFGLPMALVEHAFEDIMKNLGKFFEVKDFKKFIVERSGGDLLNELEKKGFETRELREGIEGLVKFWDIIEDTLKLFVRPKATAPIKIMWGIKFAGKRVAPLIKDVKGVVFEREESVKFVFDNIVKFCEKLENEFKKTSKVKYIKRVKDWFKSGGQLQVVFQTLHKILHLELKATPPTIPSVPYGILETQYIKMRNSLVHLLKFGVEEGKRISNPEKIFRKLSEAKSEKMAKEFEEKWPVGEEILNGIWGFVSLRSLLRDMLLVFTKNVYFADEGRVVPKFAIFRRKIRFEKFGRFSEQWKDIYPKLEKFGKYLEGLNISDEEIKKRIKEFGEALEHMDMIFYKLSKIYKF